MKLNRSMMLSLFVLGAATVSAQSVYTDSEGVAYQFRKHAFITLQGGAQYTLGEAKFDKLISPNVQLGIGYQFTPWLGARIQANAWQSKGGYNGVTETGGVAPHNVTYKFKYVAPGLDLMFNLSNAFFGWNPNRVFNVTAFVGGGVNVAFDNDEAQRYAAICQMRYIWDGTKARPYGRGGVGIDFRVSDAVSIMLEGNANILSDKYNSKKAGNADWYFNGLVGVRVNLGKTYRQVSDEEPAAPVEEYVTPTPAPTPVPVPEVKPVQEEKKAETIRRDVFFTINSTQLSVSERQKVKEVASFLEAHPASKVAITGYADAGTGNDKINDRLARQRAEKIADTLRDDYGVSPDRITVDSKGSHEQPFAENDKNRVSVCLAE